MKNINGKETLNLETSQSNIAKWKGHKNGLVEVIYAMIASEAIDNDETSINQLTQIFSKVFQVDLGNVYKIYGEIKSRESQPTKFLDMLKQSLLNRIKKDNEK